MDELAAAARATIAAGTARYRLWRVSVPAPARTLHGVHEGRVDFAQGRSEDRHTVAPEAVRIVARVLPWIRSDGEPVVLHAIRDGATLYGEDPESGWVYSGTHEDAGPHAGLGEVAIVCDLTTVADAEARGDDAHGRRFGFAVAPRFAGEAWVAGGLIARVAWIRHQPTRPRLRSHPPLTTWTILELSDHGTAPPVTPPLEDGAGG